MVSFSKSGGPSLVVDWDGTITERDSLVMVLEHFGDWEECKRLGDQLFAGEITLHEEIDRQFATVTAPLEDVVAWVLENVRVRPGLPELVERFRPLVVSSGLHELIEPVLAREGLEIELLANRAVPSPEGWRVIWRDETLCPVCGRARKRRTYRPKARSSMSATVTRLPRRARSDRCLATRGLAKVPSTSRASPTSRSTTCSTSRGLEPVTS